MNYISSKEIAEMYDNFYNKNCLKCKKLNECQKDIKSFDNKMYECYKKLENKISLNNQYGIFQKVK